MKIKICKNCKIEKPTSQFHRHNSNKDGLGSNCKTCYSKKQAISTEIRRFGIPKKEIFSLIEGKCTICGTTDGTLCIHHIDGKGRDYHTPNNNIENLSVVCNKCHAKLHLRDIGGKLKFHPLLEYNPQKVIETKILNLRRKLRNLLHKRNKINNLIIETKKEIKIKRFL